jgi:uncharacterized protein involved in exopolysaccharide biosynthesis
MIDPINNPTSMVEDDEIDLLDLVHTMAENLRLLLVGPLVAGLAVLGYAFTITPTFTANTTFLPPQQQQSAAASMLASLGGLAGLAGGVAGIKNPNDQYIAFMKSRVLQDALIARFGLMERFEAKTPTDARNALDTTATISAGKDGLISVKVDSDDPQFAAQLANAYVEELQNLLAKLAVTEAQQRRTFFEQQLQNARDNLVKSEAALQASGVNASALKSQPQAAVTIVAQLQAQITAQPSLDAQVAVADFERTSAEHQMTTEAGTRALTPDTLNTDLQSATRLSEHQVIMATLASTPSKTEAAKRLGISPRTLRYKMAQLREHGLTMASAC